MPKIRLGRRPAGDKIPAAESTETGDATGEERGHDVAATRVSLIEAMLSLSIAGVLSTAAVPAMRDALVQQRLRGSSSDPHASFHLAPGSDQARQFGSGGTDGRAGLVDRLAGLRRPQ